MDLVVMARDMLTLYFHQPHKKIEGAEVPFVVPLINPSNGERLGINLEGFIDLIEEEDTIVEFKTVCRQMVSDISVDFLSYIYRDSYYT